MIIFPYHSFTIETTCSENQVQEKLQHFIDTAIGKFNLKLYEGKISKKEFKIWLRSWIPSWPSTFFLGRIEKKQRKDNCSHKGKIALVNDFYLANFPSWF